VRSRFGQRLLGAYVTLILLFLFTPTIVIVLASLTRTQFIVFPPRGLTLHWYAALLQHRDFLSSLGLSMVVALGTALVATTLGTLGAFALARYRLRGRELVQQLFNAPLLIPSVVLGVALLQWYTHIHLAASVAALVIGHVVLSLPFVVRLVSASLAGYDRTLERAAANLGANAWQVFFRLTLPLIRAGVIAGALFSFVTSFDDLTVALFVVSTNVVTLPVRIFTYMQFNYDPTITSISTVMVILTLGAMLLMERVLGMSRIFGVADAE